MEEDPTPVLDQRSPTSVVGSDESEEIPGPQDLEQQSLQGGQADDERIPGPL